MRVFETRKLPFVQNSSNSDITFLLCFVLAGQANTVQPSNVFELPASPADRVSRWQPRYFHYSYHHKNSTWQFSSFSIPLLDACVSNRRRPKITRTFLKANEVRAFMKITLHGALSRLFVTSSAKTNKIWTPKKYAFRENRKTPKRQYKYERIKYDVRWGLNLKMLP